MCVNPLGDWLLAKEAAEISGYSLEHVRRLARAGRIESQKWGRDWIISRESLLAYIKNEGYGPEPKRKPLDKM